MMDYQYRVVAEKDDLDDKIEKLRNFLVSEKYGEIDGDEQARLHLQYSIMAAYSCVLKMRISAFVH